MQAGPDLITFLVKRAKKQELRKDKLVKDKEQRRAKNKVARQSRKKNR